MDQQSVLQSSDPADRAAGVEALSAAEPARLAALQAAAEEEMAAVAQRQESPNEQSSVAGRRMTSAEELAACNAWRAEQLAALVPETARQDIASEKLSYSEAVAVYAQKRAIIDQLDQSLASASSPAERKSAQDAALSQIQRLEAASPSSIDPTSSR